MKQNILLAVLFTAALIGGWFARGLVKRPSAASPARLVSPPPVRVVPPPVAPEITAAPVAEQSDPAGPSNEPGETQTEELLRERLEQAIQSDDSQAIKAARKALTEARHERHYQDRMQRKEDARREKVMAKRRREEFLKDFPDPNRPTGPLVPPIRITPRILDENGKVIEDPKPQTGAGE